MNQPIQKHTHLKAAISITLDRYRIDDNHFDEMHKTISAKYIRPWRGAHVLALLETIDTIEMNLDCKELGLLKLMVLYHDIDHDRSKNRKQNLAMNAQFAVMHLANIPSLTDDDRDSVYGGIISIIDQENNQEDYRNYYKASRTPEVVKWFIDICLFMEIWDFDVPFSNCDNQEVISVRAANLLEKANLFFTQHFTQHEERTREKLLLL
jgi:hypothetical protein